MLYKYLLLGLISFFSIALHAQDGATPEGQKAILHCTRFYEGTPIKKFSSKIDSFTLEKGKFSNAAPAIYDGIVYAGTDANSGVAVTTAGIITKYELENGGAVEGAPAVTKDKVFIGFKNNLFAAFSKDDGKLLWKYEPKGPVTTTPLVHGNRVYFTTSNGFCYCLDAEYGSFKWKFSVLSKASSPAYSEGVSFDKDLVIVGTDRQQIYALSAKDGNQIWVYNGAGGQPVIGDNSIYAAEKIGSIVSIDKNSGRRLWHYKGYLVEGTTDLALANNTLIFGNSTTVLAIDSRVSEGFKWKKELLRSLACGPIIVGNIVYIVALDKKIYALDLNTGDELDRFDLGFSPYSSPAFIKNMICYPNGSSLFFINGK